MRSRDKNQIFNLCFKNFLKIKIFEIKSTFSFWPLKSGKIYIQQENDIHNPKAKLSTNKNHSRLANSGQVSPPYPLASRLRLTGSARFCFSSLLEYSITQGLALSKPQIKKILNYFRLKPFDNMNSNWTGSWMSCSVILHSR